MFEWALGDDATARAGPALPALDQRSRRHARARRRFLGRLHPVLGGRGRRLSWSCAGGNDYVLTVDDDFVGAGQPADRQRHARSAPDHAMFDGSAETDGRFAFLGGDGNDFFFGGAGNDRFSGGGGADSLTGGGGGRHLRLHRRRRIQRRQLRHARRFRSGRGQDRPAGQRSRASTRRSPAARSPPPASTQDLAAALGGLGAGQAVLVRARRGRPRRHDLPDRRRQRHRRLSGRRGLCLRASPAPPLADLAGHTDFFV